MENNIDTMTITRKFVLIPAKSDRKEWNKKITNHLVESYEETIEYFKNKKAKTKEEKKEVESKILHYSNMIEEAKNGNFTKQMINKYTYDLVKEAMESEARRKNYILSWAFSEMVANGVQFMDFKDRYKFINEMIKPAYRVKGSKKGSLFDDTEIDSILKGYGNGFSQELTSKIKDSVKNGLLEGKVPISTYKLDSPFSVPKDYISLSHDYESFEELCEHINDEDCKIYLNYGKNNHPTIARFEICTGTNKNKQELNSTLLKLFSGEYEMCGSSIGTCKDGKKIEINMSIKIPKKQMELDENTVVGVDLGMAIPATCALNNDLYQRCFIGSADDFLRIRTKLQAQSKRLYKALKSTTGGHGRKKKLKALEKLRKRERHFVQSYNHFVSKQVVDFALKHRAKYINIEDLSGYDSSKFILRNWSYYELQQYITYKAEKYGIEVRKINPCYTSQVCSLCGHFEEGQRLVQAVFNCKNDSCNNKKVYEHGFNADFNAARNIAMSTLFATGKKRNESDENYINRIKKEAREYYGIVRENEED